MLCVIWVFDVGDLRGKQGSCRKYIEFGVFPVPHWAACPFLPFPLTLSSSPIFLSLASQFTPLHPCLCIFSPLMVQPSANQPPTPAYIHLLLARLCPVPSSLPTFSTTPSLNQNITYSCSLEMLPDSLSYLSIVYFLEYILLVRTKVF